MTDLVCNYCGVELDDDLKCPCCGFNIDRKIKVYHPTDRLPLDTVKRTCKICGTQFKTKINRDYCPLCRQAILLGANVKDLKVLYAEFKELMKSENKRI